MATTVTIADDVAAKLQPFQAQIPEIIELGLREWCARSEPGYNSVREVLQIFASLPTPEDVLALRPTPQLQERLSALLEKNRISGLTADNEREWEQYKYLEYLVRLAKANAVRVLRDRNGP